jgi:hypothetical protein
MSNPSSDSYRNPLRHTGQDYSFAPRFLRSRDPLSPTHASRDTKPKENQGYYPFGSLWNNSVNGNVWILAGITNNLANWVLIGNSTGNVITLSDTAGTIVSPSPTGNIQLMGQVVEQNPTSPFNTVVANVSNFSISFNPMSPARWIVDPFGQNDPNTPNGTHTTITAAVAAANTGDTILLMPGNYTENFTLTKSIVIAAPSGNDSAATIITGKITIATAINASIANVVLQTNSDYAVLMTGNQNSFLTLENCFISATDFDGIAQASTGASSTMNLINCRGTVGAGRSVFTMTSNGSLSFQHCQFSNIGGSTTQSTASSGILNLLHSQFSSPITMSGTVQGLWEFSSIDTLVINVTPLTVTSSGTTKQFNFCRFFSGSAPAISVSDSILLSMISVLSDNTNAIAGTGTIIGDTTQFNGTSSGIQSTITLNPRGLGTKGVFTPTLDGAVPGVTTYAAQAGYYTVIGKMCFVRFTIATTAATGTGDLIFAGLPFTIKNDSNGSPFGTLLSASGAPLAWPIGTTMLSIQGIVGTTTAKVYASGSAVAGGYLKMANTTINLQCSLVYEID